MRFLDTWLRIEAGQLDRAAVLAADLSEVAERHGFDMWRLEGRPAGRHRRPGRTRRRPGRPDRVAAHIATITTLLDTLRTLG